ncbi:hypothetical protein BGZ82_010042 [Podila clonocystis]|nr:hypothetical protein BGZ82_010042 [Podila clonocystis]
MGVLTPNCVATDGTSLYALTRTNKYGERDANYHVLIKSNASPASIQDIRWTLVNVVPRSTNNYLTGQYACTVNEKGVFTVVSDKAQVSETFTGAVGFKGIQFVPGSSGVEGSWHNADTEGFFTEWPYKEPGFMFNFKDTSGTSTPMVTYIHSSSKAPFVAAMNPEGNKFAGGVVGWNMSAVTYGEPVSIVGLNNKVFIYGYYDFGTNNTLSVVTLPSPYVNLTSATPPPIQMVNATLIETTCDRAYLTMQMYTHNSNVILMCTSSKYGDNHIFTFDGTTITHLPPVKGMYSFRPDSFVPIGSSSPFIFMHDYEGVYSVALNGPTASTFSPGNFAINISDPYGKEPTSSGAPGNKPTSTPSGGGSAGAGNAALQVGAGLGAFVVLVALVCLWFRRRKRIPSRLRVLQDQQQYRQPPAVAEIPVIKHVNISPPPAPPAYHPPAAPILISTQAPAALAHHGYANATPIMKPMPPLPTQSTFWHYTLSIATHHSAFSVAADCFAFSVA